MNEIWWVITRKEGSNKREFYSSMDQGFLRISKLFSSAWIYGDAQTASYSLDNLLEKKILDESWEIREIKVCME